MQWQEDASVVLLWYELQRDTTCNLVLAAALPADCHDLCALCSEPFLSGVWHEHISGSSKKLSCCRYTYLYSE